MSDSLNEELPIEMTIDSFKERDIFSIKRLVGTARIIGKNAFFIGQVPI